MGQGYLQTNFASGELDPRLRGRLWLDQYYQGLEKAENGLILAQGGIQRRPGQEFIDELPKQIDRITSGAISSINTPNGGTGANANDDDTATELATTTDISTTDPYVVVEYDLGADTTVLFAEVVGFRLTSGSVSGEFRIQYRPNGGSYSDLGDPFDALTDDRNRRRTGPVTARYLRFVRVGSTDLGTATAAVDEFNLWTESGTDSNVRLVPFIVSEALTYVLAYTDRNIRVFRDGVRQVDVRTAMGHAELPVMGWTQSLETLIAFHADVPPAKLLRQGADDEWQEDPLVFTKIPQYAFALSFSNPDQDLTPSNVDGITKLTLSGAATFDWGSSHVDQYVEGNGGRVRITQINSNTEAVGLVVVPFFSTDKIVTGSWTLEEGYEDSWSATRGWPKTGTFYQGRLWIGGSKERPDSLWASKVNLFFDFGLNQGLPDDAIDVVLQARELPVVRNVMPGRHLQVFTSAAEFYIPQDPGQPVTPDNITLRQTTSRGAQEGIRPVETSGATLFLQRDGAAVREFMFEITEESYSATDVSLLSAHLLNNPQDMALRRSTAGDQADLLILVNTDGTLAVLTTLRDQRITAWTPQRTPAAEGAYEAVAIDDQQVYFAVRRQIDGDSRLFVEKWRSDHYMDAGVVGGATSGQEITGLDHLEGETVDILLDGTVQPQETVSAGKVTLERDADNSHQAGLPYRPDWRIMPIQAQLPDGVRLGRRKRMVEVNVEVYQTKELAIDGDQVPFRQFGDSLLDEPVEQFTGRKHVRGRLGWAEEIAPTFAQSTPTPLTLLSAEIVVGF